MKFTFFVTLWAFIFALVCASVCPPVAADIWTSGKVVYTTNALGDLDIAVMGPNGEHVDYLTSSTDDEFDPTWSPDGTEILYTRVWSGNENEKSVWLVDADGSNPRHIVSFSEHPSWAPDGDHFVARSKVRSFPAGIIIRALSAARNDYRDVDNADVARSGNPAYPAWSPDGNYIAYVAGGTNPDEPMIGASLYVYDVAAERSTKIVNGITGRNMSNPTWGPQSNRILFAWEDADDSYEIYTVWRDGDRLAAFWSGPFWLFHPTVAPYGGEIIVTRYDSGHRDLYKVTRRTNNWQRLDPDSGSFNDDADWWHPSSFSVEPGASQLTTTWGDLKKQGR